MIIPVTHQQHGQAALEAIFICMILVTLLFAIQFSGHYRSRSLDLLGESSYETFLKAEHASKNHAEDAKPSEPGGLLHTFGAQLLNVSDQGVIRVQRETRQALDRRLAANRLLGTVTLQRTSYLYSQDGHSGSPSEVQSRIGRSAAAWSDVTNPTHKLLRSHIATLEKIDMPWRRKKLQLEWLNDWAGQVPRLPQSRVRRE